MAIAFYGVNGLGDNKTIDFFKQAAGDILGTAIQQSGITTQVAEKAATAATTGTKSFFQEHKWEFILGGVAAILVLGILGYSIYLSGKGR